MEAPERPRLPIGEIVTTHGLKGWLKLHPYNPETRSLQTAKTLYLEKGEAHLARELEAARPWKRDFLVKLRGIDDIAAAERLVGCRVEVAEEELEPLRPGEYYYHQIIGCDVFDSGGRWLGRITRLWSKPGGDLYVVSGSEKEWLVPAAKEFLARVDLASRRVIVELPEGLLEL